MWSTAGVGIEVGVTFIHVTECFVPHQEFVRVSQNVVCTVQYSKCTMYVSTKNEHPGATRESLPSEGSSLVVHAASEGQTLDFENRISTEHVAI